jgi:hypothetical protein
VRFIRFNAFVNINKDENKSLISHQFSLKNDPPPHFLENYFAEVKIKNDHMIDKMEDRVKHADYPIKIQHFHMLGTKLQYRNNIKIYSHLICITLNFQIN